MDIFHDFAFPLTIASILGAAAVVRRWVEQINKQIVQMNGAHQETLKLIAVLRVEAVSHTNIDDLRFKDLHRRISILEKADVDDGGYA